MDFRLTEEQLMLQKMLRELSQHEIEPLAAQIEKTGRLPDDLIKRLAGLGLFGMTIPKDYGGAGMNNLASVLAVEQLAQSGTAAWWLVALNNSIPECIYHFATEAQKKKFLKPLCDGTAYSSIMFTEENTGSDPEALTSTAKPDGNDYLINGMKRFITFGARNGYATFYAKDETGKCSAFIIEKNVAGYSAPKIWDLMGEGGIEAADVYLENVRVPGENLLGERGKGFNALLYWISTEKIEQCAASVGLAQAALDEAIKYAKSRVVRGKPMSEMQGIRWMLAEMYAKIQASRWLTYRTAYLQDQEDPNWMTEAAATKMFVVPATMKAVEIARRIHGAYGYTREVKVERLYRAICGASAIAVSLEINKSIVGASLAR